MMAEFKVGDRVQYQPHKKWKTRHRLAGKVGTVVRITEYPHRAFQMLVVSYDGHIPAEVAESFHFEAAEPADNGGVRGE